MQNAPSPHLPVGDRMDRSHSFAAATAQSGRPPHLRGRRILVVEDEYLLAMDLEEALRAVGATVVGPAPDLVEAFDAVEGEALDGAILDVRLRGGDVFPLADRLREIGVAFLLVTGIDEGDVPPRYADAPRCAKPLDMNTAVAALAELMDT